ARHVAAKQKVPVGIFSLEMSKDQLVDRMICSEASVDLWKMRTGKLSDDGTNDDFSRIGHAIGVLSEAPIYIDDSASANIMEIRTKARRLQMEYGLGLVVVDYLQLMESRSGNSDNRVQEVTEITRGLKSIARELNVPVLALSQLSRQVELQKPAIPRLAHLRESGCLAGDTLITRADTGEQVCLKDIVEGKVRTPFPVFALDDEWKIVTRPMTKAFSSGKKTVYELRTRSGRSIRASANHPFRTLDGWHALEELRSKTRIALPRVLKTNKAGDRITLDELALLAHLLGDGCTVQHQPIHYTSADEKNLDIVERVARSLFGIKPRRISQKNWWHTYLPSPFHLTHGKKNPITEWLINLGIGLRHSYDKKIPAAVFDCSNRKISHFLHHLWATDGNISWKKSAERMPSAAIYFCSTSKILAQGVQHLLLRLGILSTLRTVSQGKYRPRYEVQVQGAQNQIAFLELVGCHGKRGEIIQDMLIALRAIESNTNLDTIPREAWDTIICEEKNRIGCSWRKLSSALDMKYCGSTLMKHGIGRERMARVAMALKNKKIQALAESDVYWDEIISITKLGVEEVYDATVPELHNFVANDIVAHNSIEQDADIVLFIYRKAVDKNYRTEDLSPEEKNLAEIHIAKHRNGPTGQIKLFFDAARASFRNLNRQSAGHPLPPAMPQNRLNPPPPPQTTPFDPNTPIVSSN
ncbi:intein-containing replicative DNA helicase, partial [Patescibacteria group bacterium]|nr:intein-containing replicative DNA helicase [Patescibacteria group bacterium]MBU1629773.1 intein-containing replicative DNA helicase [Patescibacteria group bacterium]MBU1907935.1 intein-containing replicative DNA helicase [Patescibacteria group bacterium]